MKRKKVQSEIFIFILILLAVPFYWSSLKGNFQEKSIIEGRFLSVFPKIENQEFRNAYKHITEGDFLKAHDAIIRQFKDRKYQSAVEIAAADQFPLRISLIQISKTFDRSMIQLAYLFLEDIAIPTDNKSDISIMRDRSFFVRGEYLFNQTQIQYIDRRIENYRELIALYPDQNFYIFYHQLISQSRLDPRVSYLDELDHGRSFDYFEKHLPENLNFASMLLTKTADYQQNYYLTDHHWNIRGAWKAYEKIYEMLASNYPGISEKLKIIEYKTYPDLTFLGTFHRDTLYPLQPEPFEIAKINYPDCIIKKDSQVIKYNQQSEYWAGIFERNPYISHYAEYFGTNEPLLEYICPANTSRNLLVFGDSYKTPLQPWLASHYQHSYFVTLPLNDDFSLGEFLKQHKIDDILIIGDQIAISNPSWVISQ